MSLISTPNTLPADGYINGHVVSNRVFDLASSYVVALNSDEANDIYAQIVRCAVLSARARRESPDTNLADLIGERALMLMRDLQRLDVDLLVDCKIAERDAQTNTGDGSNNMQRKARRAAWRASRGFKLSADETRLISARLRHRSWAGAREIGDNDRHMADYAAEYGSTVADAVKDYDRTLDYEAGI